MNDSSPSLYVLGLEKEETPRKMLMRGRENPDRGANDMQMLGIAP